MLFPLIEVFGQYNDYALGARVGGGDGYSFEGNLQMPLGHRSNKRLEITGGMVGGNSWNSVTSYGSNIMFLIVDHLEMGWQWYYGGGLFVGASTYYGTDIDEGISRTGDKFLNVGIVPTIGLEKRYKHIPFIFSIDFRPNIPVVNINYANWGSIGISLRYRLNQ